jgi:GTP-binding protein
VIDTGGYIVGSDDIFEQAIREQVSVALEESDVILFMVDCREGITDIDKEFASVVRGIKKPVYVIANKADTPDKANYIGDFYQLGLGEVYPISSQNGSGTGELLDQVSSHFVIEEEKENEEEAIPRFTIIGRPNVGKSSFLNALTGKQRSIVTDIAGTTRDAIHTHYNLFGKSFILVDTAGIRKKTKVTEDIEFFSVLRAIRALEESDVCVVIIDAKQGLEIQDVNLIGLAERNKKGIVLMVNKWDLIEKDTKTSQAFEKTIRAKLAPIDYLPIIFTSVLNKQRIFQVIEKAGEVYELRKQRISTSKLNEILLQEIENYPPPALKGKYVKIKYITQLPTPTPTFAFFCNLPQYIKVSYERFLENKIRAHFNFEGVPIKLVFRKK